MLSVQHACASETTIQKSHDEFSPGEKFIVIILELKHTDVPLFGNSPPANAHNISRVYRPLTCYERLSKFIINEIFTRINFCALLARHRKLVSRTELKIGAPV